MPPRLYGLIKPTSKSAKKTAKRAADIGASSSFFDSGSDSEGVGEEIQSQGRKKMRAAEQVVGQGESVWCVERQSERREIVLLKFSGSSIDCLRPFLTASALLCYLF